MKSILSILVLLAMLCACGAAFKHSVDMTIEQQDRAELLRCQEGYQAACKRWQQIQQNYAAGERTLSEHVPQSDLSAQVSQHPLAASNY